MPIYRRICFILFAIIFPCTLFLGCGDDSVKPAQEEEVQWKDPAKQIELLEAKEPLVRRMAAGNLGRMGADAKDAIPALEKLKDDPDPKVQEDAKKAIELIQQVPSE